METLPVPDQFAHYRPFLEPLDDQGFCQTLFIWLERNNQIRDEHDLPDFGLLYAPWVLDRLKTIHERAAHIFFGDFVTPLRMRYPRQVMPSDLLAAMKNKQVWFDGTLGDVVPDHFRAGMEQFRREGNKPGCSPGWSNVAQHYTVRPGEITVVTGIASHLKSTWVQALCVNLARFHQWHFGLFAPEHQPVGQLGKGLAELYVGLLESQMPDEMYADAVDWVTQHFHPIEPPEEVAPTFPWILAVARAQVQRYQLKGLVIDPWNEVDHQMPHGQSTTQYVSTCLSQLRRFARYHQVHAWVVAHPTKLQKAEKGKYAGKYPPPTPYDISDSAHWYNKSDNCVTSWRNAEEDSPVVELHFQKIRYRTVGKPGAVMLTFTGSGFVEDGMEEDGTWHH